MCYYKVGRNEIHIHILNQLVEKHRIFGRKKTKPAVGEPNLRLVNKKGGAACTPTLYHTLTRMCRTVCACCATTHNLFAENVSGKPSEIQYCGCGDQYSASYGSDKNSNPWDWNKKRSPPKFNFPDTI